MNIQNRSLLLTRFERLKECIYEEYCIKSSLEIVEYEIILNEILNKNKTIINNN